MLQRGQHVGQRLARAGDGRADEVAARERSGDGRRLDGRGPQVPALGQGAQQVGVQAQGGEGHEDQATRARKLRGSVENAAKLSGVTTTGKACGTCLQKADSPRPDFLRPDFTSMA